ncbi:MAG: RpiB/LacA/LacB family sugar-phosphate isomerase, ribose 5-phosphate isomerase B [Candidatus Peregrinibacteria bacterium GW2011_GWF2_39_17]|nr:MAG: RpiB/LacA/LacB family sugar-phosphate isomerase, ribose 5-phosphate isomerase B [Candidatus Peregrinibacteria bacterium GW2011_GWF2_39_17]HCW32656.1 ribose 5-phosphate isomerase B [Candidatus Peregrinibacteria bacterium]
MQQLYLGSDHAGYGLKNNLKDYIETLGYTVVDLGVFSEATYDYPDIAREVAEKVYENLGSFGVLICGTGTGMCIVANKHVGIRGASCSTEELAHYARAHNNANVLCLGQRIIDEEKAKKILAVFLKTPFEGGRHQARVDKIEVSAKN